MVRCQDPPRKMAGRYLLCRRAERAVTAEVGEESTGLLKVKQVAVMLSVAEVTVWRLVGSGELESIKVGRSRRIDPAAVEAYKKRQTSPQAGAA